MQYLEALRNALMADFPQRLREIRLSRKLTQTRLAELLEVKPQVVYRWESGQASPQFEKLLRLSDILSVTLDELVGREDANPDYKINNYKLHQLVQDLDHLPDEEQRALILIIESVVKRYQATKMFAVT